jgi:glucose-6-phosphate dehydrogenase assembly protein OpcA
VSAVKPAWRGTDVSVGDVLQQLRVMRAAAAGQPRSSVLDVIIVASDSAEALRAAAVVEKLAVHHPCRALIVVDEPGGGPSRIDATITERNMEPGADRPPHEQVLLSVRGPAAEHIPSLVDCFLLPDVTTFVWWTGSPQLRGARFLATLEAADVLLLDSARFERPFDSFAALAEVAAANSGTVFGDFHWTRLQPWREVLAQFFNPGDRRGFLRGIGAVGVDYIAEGRGNRSAAVLLAGWLGSALGWRLSSSTARGGGVLAAHFNSAAGHPVELALRPVEMAGFAAGEITGIRIDAVSRGHLLVHALRDESDNDHVMVQAEVRGMTVPRLVLPVPAKGDEAILSRLLIEVRSDRAYPRALQLGAEILRSART